jgi:hypothetical protein
MQIFRSRLTPNLENGEDVSFSIGETVTVLLADGLTKISAIIQSDRMLSYDGEYLGYEAIVSDTQALDFVPAIAIVDWAGKVNK